MKKLLTRWLVSLANRRMSPPQILMGGDKEQMDARNFFTLYFIRNDGSVAYFRGADKTGADLRLEDPESKKFDIPVTATFKELASYDVDCRFYYKGGEFRYSNRLWMFITYNLLFWKIAYKFSVARQYFFNQKSIPLVSRVQLMRYLAERNYSQKDYRANVYDRLHQKYGLTKLHYHPDIKELLRMERILLDSLVKSGELSIESSGYIVNGKIYETLENIDIADRRHWHGMTVQIALIVVAIASAVAAGFQAYAALTSRPR